MKGHTTYVYIVPNLWKGMNICYLHPTVPEIVFQAAIDHEWKDEERVAIWGIEANSHLTQNIWVTKVFHDQTLGKECLHFLL